MPVQALWVDGHTGAFQKTHEPLKLSTLLLTAWLCTTTSIALFACWVKAP